MLINKKRTSSKSMSSSKNSYNICFQFYFFIVIYIGDIQESNSRPEKQFILQIFCLSVEPESLTAQKSENVRLFDASNAVNETDVICVSESYLNSSLLSVKINIKVCKLLRTDHSNKTKEVKRWCL